MAAELLLVEDNRNDMELTLRALKSVNIVNQVHAVRDGKEALDYLFNIDDHGDECVKNCPKVIMLDLKIPRISGIDVLKKIKSNVRTKSIPIVIVTSSNQTDDVNQCYAIGANSYIVKPLNLEDFMSSISKAGAYWLFINHLSG
ncbi:MAG: response regulator [Thaumarchaeota archaeon]|nr:response regulator [Nitrososphaerota archaeon]